MNYYGKAPKDIIRRFRLDRLRSIRGFIVNELVRVQELIAKEEQEVLEEAEGERDDSRELEANREQ